MQKSKRQWASAPLTPEKTRAVEVDQVAKQQAPQCTAWGVMCTREGNKLKWMRIGVDTEGRVHPVDEMWQPMEAVPHVDVSDLGISRYTDAALQSCMLKPYGGPQ